MDQNEIKAFIAGKVPEGYSLSKIQDLLKEQGVHITFMELRLLASEIEEDLFRKEEAREDQKKQKAEQAAAPVENKDPEPSEETQAPLSEEAPAENAEQTIQGKTTVELSKLARPGAVASGTVKFGSGVTAEWILDQMGRLGLDKASGKPTQQDIQEFQVELQKLLS